MDQDGGEEEDYTWIKMVEDRRTNMWIKIAEKRSITFGSRWRMRGD